MTQRAQLYLTGSGVLLCRSILPIKYVILGGLISTRWTESPNKTHCNLPDGHNGQKVAPSGAGCAGSNPAGVPEMNHALFMEHGLS